MIKLNHSVRDLVIVQKSIIQECVLAEQDEIIIDVLKDILKILEAVSNDAIEVNIGNGNIA